MRRYSDKAQKVNEVTEALSHHLRREVVHYFENCTSDETATLKDLASHIAQRVPEMNQENATLHLVHTHVPKLESHGWVEYDHHTQQVRYRDHDSAEVLLAELDEIFH